MDFECSRARLAPASLLLLLALFCVSVILAGTVKAQQAPPAPVPAPTLAPEIRDTLEALRDRVVAIQWMRAVLQREEDLVLAEYQRIVRATQVPGYRLDLETGTYVAADVKK